MANSDKSDKLPMTTLSYATGPNFNQTFPDKNGQRANLTGTVFRRFLVTNEIRLFFVVIPLASLDSCN